MKATKIAIEHGVGSVQERKKSNNKQICRRSSIPAVLTRANFDIHESLVHATLCVFIFF